MTDRYTIPSLARAFLILDVLAEESDGVSLAEMARTTKIPKSTVFRILRTLQQCEAITPPDENRRFHLGPQLLTLGNHYAALNDLA